MDVTVVYALIIVGYFVAVGIVLFVSFRKKKSNGEVTEVKLRSVKEEKKTEDNLFIAECGVCHERVIPEKVIIENRKVYKCPKCNNIFKNIGEK